VRHFFFALVFFFSSRRRHTRSKRDWSSDVCSSDLRSCFESARAAGSTRRPFLTWMFIVSRASSVSAAGQYAHDRHADRDAEGDRSEERRVGKECRCRGWAWDEEKNGRKRDVARRYP